MGRGLILFAYLLLAGCSANSTDDATTAVEAGDRTLACAIGPGAGFSESCTLQKFEREGATVYRVNHPGGGFRLFVVAEDGSGMVLHDGAGTALNRLDGAILEVAVGDDRYRFAARADAQ